MTDHQLEMDSRHNYWCVAPGHETQPCHGVTFKSVTTLLNKAVPKDLSWHGQTRGIAGVKALMTRGYDLRSMSVPAITDALKKEKLTVNDHMADAAAGGTAVHKALEDYGEKRTLPNAAAVPESKRGSIRGLAQFMVQYQPVFLGTEVRVLSVVHGYAGTFDLLARIGAELYEVPKRGGGSYVKLRPSSSSTMTALIDLKTSKWVYPASHFPQLEAYEGARVEMGAEPTDVRAVLWTSAQGDMELVPSVSSFDDFLKLKASAEVNTRLDRSWSRPKRKAA